MAVTKIATCCYCGTRAALTLRGKERQELSCSNCGAPLHAMKMLPMAATRTTRPAETSARPNPKKRRDNREERHVSRPKKRRKTKSFGRKVLSELWDVIEDVVEEVFD